MPFMFWESKIPAMALPALNHDDDYNDEDAAFVSV